jgi:DNA-binding beta-propeller fold protein YncE
MRLSTRLRATIPMQIRLMHLYFLSLLTGALLMGAGPARAQLALTLESKIPLGDIRGRLDHMAVDLHRQRLFVAELENDSVGVIDFERREIVHMITDVKRPQGLAYVPAADTLFVANGGDGSLRMFEGAQYRALEPIHVGDDADNLRFDPESNLIYVAYGEGALGIVDVASRRKIRDLALTAHPESFQLERQTNRIYVNVPKEQAIVVMDQASGHRLANWQTRNASNFPLALNADAGHVLAIFRNPASLVAFAAASGTPLAKVETCGDADDMFVDPKRRRVYVSCGDGFLDVFNANPYKLIERIPTIKGARTSLLVPDIDRLFVAARGTAEAPAAVWVFRPGP